MTLRPERPSQAGLIDSDPGVVRGRRASEMSEADQDIRVRGTADGSMLGDSGAHGPYVSVDGSAGGFQMSGLEPIGDSLRARAMDRGL